MRRLFLLFLSVFVPVASLFLAPTVAAQTVDTEFYPVDDGFGGGFDGYRQGDFGFDLGSGLDSGSGLGSGAGLGSGFGFEASVFNTPAWSARDVFGDFARYRLNAARYRERGLDDRHNRVSLGGIDLTDNILPYPDWTLITLARRAGLASEQVPAMVALGAGNTSGGTGGASAVANTVASLGRAEKYSLTPSRDEFYVSGRAGNRYSRAAADIRYSRTGADGWRTLVAGSGELGNDGFIAGVGSEGLGGVVSASKEWKTKSRLTFFAAGNLSKRGMRTAATDEAFSLTDNPLYNPMWGWQNGRVRNSRENRVAQFFGAVQFETTAWERTTVSLTAAYRHDRDGRTRLSWYDTHSPLPDYYRSMPSFFPDWSAAETIADAWRTGDPGVTQIDWQSMYYSNTLNPDGHTTYIVEEQVELARDAHLNLTANTLINSHLRVSYGLGFRHDNSRFFKVADDLLGADWVPNIDQYATDTDGEYHVKPPNDNDLRHPDRQVRQGERFGYDYAFVRTKSSAFGAIDWRTDDYGIVASGSLTFSQLWRQGFYEKELFVGASFGRSKKMAFTAVSASLSAYYNLSARHGFSLSTLIATEPPMAGDIFLSPEQNSLTVGFDTAENAGGGPGNTISDLRPLAPSTLFGMEAAWAFTGEAIRAKVAAFLNSATGETDVRRYYDDLSSTFSDMVVRGIDRLNFGVELGIEASLTRELTLRAAGSVGRNRYNSEPSITLHDDATGDVYASGITGYMSGLSTGSPSVVGAAELEYYDRRRWRASVTGEFLGRRYVEINPLYHSSRIVGINPATEIMDAFTSQQRLPDAFTLGASLSKGWVVGSGYLRVAATVRNLLSTSVISSGYEQMRIRRQGSGVARVLVPFPAKYTYSWPATWNLTVSYRL